MSTTEPPVLAARGLSAGHARRVVVADLTLEVRPRTVTALVGPNGSGKSTLLMTLARVLRRQAGEVLLDDRPIDRLPSTEVARRLGVLPQTAVVPTGATVRELVEQGRYPQLGPWAMLRRHDDGAMRRALELTGLTPLADRRLDSLSGGERQRAWIAMTLAQETGVLLLDEPTTYLDVRHQIDLMRLVEHLRDDHGLTVVMVLHDLNQAARHADRVVALRDGRVLADGTPREVLTSGTLRSVFDVDALVVDDPVTGRPLFVAR
ncbi:ABC transporter ATP-binding protein [Nocardioides lianchengensis]|uniref:Iron complex transport system ATP-binding protein n=1 Tax=Nocardioides lianchengensis TaxID=1045774 RepID=A0A1G6W2W3_9ACTN|nr:ABC transporter ATP-binding protein [Nocardioides lianchengensis]NYG09484.1 iron complex transport system ATP-binding protein [Nocardioides lianchengensis]SDD59385.1 iron complex transport system ATP-binding protein [Nocardioides lianchengensis]